VDPTNPSSHPGSEGIFAWQEPTRVGSEFAPTVWSQVRAAGSDSDPLRQREALEQICRIYWKPIYAFIRRQGRDSEMARDLTQDFFHHLLSKERLRLADQRRGRFRCFLLTALQNFLRSEWDRRCAKKRDERVVVPLDMTLDTEGMVVDPPSLEAGPDQWFDRIWATELFRATRQSLERELDLEGKGAQPGLLALALGDPGCPDPREVAAELGMKEPAVRKAAERLRGRWLGCLRRQIAATVLSADDIDEELRELLRVVSMTSFP